MMKRFFSAIALFFWVFTSYPAQAKPAFTPLTYRVLANGTLFVSDELHPLLWIDPTVFTDNWGYHTFGISVKDPSLQGLCDLGSGAVVSLKLKVEPLPRGLKVHYTLVPNQDVRAISVRVPVFLHYDEWAKTHYAFGKKKGLVPLNPLGAEATIATSDKETLTLGPSTAMEGFQMAVSQQGCNLSLFDNRKWSPNLIVIADHGESMIRTWDWKAGQAKDFDITITFNRPLQKEVPLSTQPEVSEDHWEGYIKDGDRTSDARIAAVIHKSAHGYRAQFTFDDAYIASYSMQVPKVSLQKGVLKAIYDDGNHLELNWDPTQKVIGGILNFWGHQRTFFLTRGEDFLHPRLDSQGQPVTTASYQAPVDLKDDIPVGDLRKNPKALASVNQGVHELLNESLYRVHSLLIYHEGQLVSEDYFYGYGPDKPHSLYSVTKSVFSTLFGIAQDQGLVNKDQKLYDLYPAYRSKPDWDPKKNDITLAMLLCMDSGFKCDNLADTCGTDIYKSSDWLDYTLSLPLDHEPGQHWTYNGTSLIPLSRWIAQKSALSIPEFSTKYLEGPLGIAPHPWEEGPNGVTRVDAAHWMTPREMLKLGILYLNGGKWKGQRILSKSWVEQAGMPQAAKSEDRDFDYGYLFWIKYMTFGKRTVKIIQANGWGGQYIFIVPDFDLVCVMTAGNYPMGSLFTMEEDFFKRYVMTPFYKPTLRERISDLFE